jgi:AcrR family transcriptional regulator
VSAAGDRTDALLAAWRSLDRARPHTGDSDTERAILSATEHLLARSSLHDVTVEQIIHEAGVSRRTFYVYFSSKHAVVGTLLVQVMQAMFAATQSSLAEFKGADPETALGKTLEATSTLWIAHGPVLRAVVEHLHSVPELRELWLQIIGQFADVFADYIDGARAAGHVFRAGDSRKLAATLAWSTERCMYIGGTGWDTDLAKESDVLEPILTIWVGALAAPGRKTPRK